MADETKKDEIDLKKQIKLLRAGLKEEMKKCAKLVEEKKTAVEEEQKKYIQLLEEKQKELDGEKKISEQFTLENKAFLEKLQRTDEFSSELV